MVQAQLENKGLRRQLKLVESRSASPFASASPQTIENAVADAEVAELRAQVAEGQVSRPARCSQLPGMLPVTVGAEESVASLACAAAVPATLTGRHCFRADSVHRCCTTATSFPDLQAQLQKLQQECAEAQDNDAKLQSQLKQVHAQLVAGRAPGAPPTPPHVSIATVEATLMVSGCPHGLSCVHRLLGAFVQVRLRHPGRPPNQ